MRIDVKCLSLGLVFMLSMFVFAGSLWGYTGSEVIFYQGRFADVDGVSLDGEYEVEFRLYDSDGQQKWGPETHTDIKFDRGVFSVYLGTSESLTGIDFNDTYSIEVQLTGVGTPYTYRDVFRPSPCSFNAYHFEGKRLAEIDWPDVAMTTEDVTKYDVVLGEVQNINQAYTAGNQLEWVQSDTVYNVLEGSGSGLDADLLEARQSGNDTGNIPINNGVMNWNLNVSYLRGDSPAVVDWGDLAIKKTDVSRADVGLGLVQNIDQATMGGQHIRWDSTNEQLYVAPQGHGDNLNADLLEGLQTGTDTGNIPINDGRVMKGLNAELLRGNPASYYKQGLPNVLSQNRNMDRNIQVQQQKIIFNDNNSGNDIELTSVPGSNDNSGIAVRTQTNPANQSSLFQVLSSGGNLKMGIDHNGYMAISGDLWAAGGLSTFQRLDMGGGRIYNPGVMNLNEHSNGRLVAPLVAP